MSQGLSYEAFAGVVGTHIDTLYHWEKIHPEFSEAKKHGVSRSRIWWERAGQSGMLGEVKGFNAAVWIFNMKNRFGWRDAQSVEHSGSLTLEQLVAGSFEGEE